MNILIFMVVFLHSISILAQTSCTAIVDNIEISVKKSNMNDSTISISIINRSSRNYFIPIENFREEISINGDRIRIALTNIHNRTFPLSPSLYNLRPLRQNSPVEFTIPNKVDLSKPVYFSIEIYSYKKFDIDDRLAKNIFKYLSHKIELIFN